jgi:hypothetical protein
MANAFDGGMMRPGGRYAGNVVLQTGIGTHHGYMFSVSAPIITDGVESTIVDNAFLGPFQYGIQIGNLSEGYAGGNIMLSPGRLYSMGFNLIGREDFGQNGLHNLTISDNYVLGTEGLEAAGPDILNVRVEHNQFRNVSLPPRPPGQPQNPPARLINHLDVGTGAFVYSSNRYFSDAPRNQWFRVQNTNYDFTAWRASIESDAMEVAAVPPADVPTVAGYNAFIGGTASEAAFLAAARQQSREGWDDRYMAAPVFSYLRMRLGL